MLQTSRPREYAMGHRFPAFFACNGRFDNEMHTAGDFARRPEPGLGHDRRAIPRTRDLSPMSYRPTPISTFVLLLALAVAACSPKPAPSTWTNAHWGMMRSEVQSAVPGLVEGSHDHLVTGAAADLRLDKTGVAGTTLPADFYFLDGTLQQITFGDSQYHDNAANAKAFDHMSANLRAQFGQEISAKTTDPAGGMSRTTTWANGDTEVLLTIAPVTATTSTISVICRHVAK